MKKPNILWICTDQQRYDSLGCYGNQYVNTPNLDKLAAEGMRFDSAFCQNPVCTPSRASFLTGRYPRTTCCRQNGQDIPSREAPVTRIFSEQGYVCGLAGKLHLSHCHPKTGNGTERRINDGYDVFSWSHDCNDYWSTNQYRHWLTERGVAYKTTECELSPFIEYGMPQEHHQTTFCVERAINFIESCAKHDTPWLFSLNIFDPHAPFDPPKEYFDRYRDALSQLPLPNYVDGELDNKPECHMQERLHAWNSSSIQRSYRSMDMTDLDKRCITAAYYAMVDLVDAQIGRLLDALAQSGQRENTVVVFMSDHGELLGDHSMYYKGPFLYDCSIRVPLIFSWPGKIAPGESTALVELIDIPETLLELAGIPVPLQMQGRSLWPLLSGQSPPSSHRDDVYCEYYNSLPWNNPGIYATMLRTDSKKLVVYHGSQVGELYDLVADPGENQNLWALPCHVDTKLELLRRLCDRMAFTCDPLPPRTAPW